MDVEDFQRLKLHEQIQLDAEVNGRSNFELTQALAVPEDNQYHPAAEAHSSADVPVGTYTKITDWSDSKVFPGTYRDIGFYLPDTANVAARSKNLPLMVFNDGLLYADPSGPLRAARVLDTMIHAGEIPAMAAIFVMPGRLSAGSGVRPAEQADLDDMAQRSFEYDSLTDTYGRFLLDEILPLAEQTLAVAFSTEPGQRAVCGISSGGICAFNTAWHYPQAFGLVVSHCGSFVNIRGGHNYPYLVRSTTRKPIRVYLTSGENDGNIIYGNWPLANQQMAQALRFAGYDYHFEYGVGGHSLRHGGALFADTLRWLWLPGG